MDAAQVRSETTLEDWLRENDARHLADIDAPTGNYRLRFYSVGPDARTVMIQEWEKGDGWDLYVPVSTGNDVRGTLQAASNLLRL